MTFTEAESKAFWPIYNEFEIELEKLANKRVQNIKRLCRYYDKMTEEKGRSVE